MNSAGPFRFYTENHLVELTGRNANNLPQLLSILREVPGASIFYHTHQRFLSHHFEKPMVYNDFAVWVGEALRENALSEKLAALYMPAFNSVRQLREAIVLMIEGHLCAIGGRARECPPGDEFHFCKVKSLVMPLGITANTIPEFFSRVKTIPNSSLYYHFLEAQLRVEPAMNDFSRWLAGYGAGELADALAAIDPYTSSLEELKEEIVELGRKKGVL
jgi:hypothetical protein